MSGSATRPPDHPPTLLCTEPFAQLHQTRLLAGHPDLRLVPVALDAPPADGALDTVEVAFASPDLHPNGIDRFLRIAATAPRLRWLQMFAAGLDYPALQLLRDHGVRITSASGATASAIARTVVFYLLALSRGARRLFAEQAAHRWSPQLYDDIAGKAIGVVGMGPIGLEVIRMSAALGMDPIGMRRSIAGDEPCETWTLDRLPQLAATVDVLVLALPLTPETQEICSAAIIGSMKPGAVLVNVGRGGLVDELALARALATGALGGAGLDVFATEPLPTESPLWDMPNVIITPHSSAASPAVVDAINQIFFDNLIAYLRGDPLINEEGSR